MVRLIIWRNDGQVTTIYLTDDQLDYECQVLDHDPIVHSYSVESL